MNSAWDFAVVGAGPAGSRAAELLARRGASVVLLDPKAPWEKPCGGGLTASVLRHTPELAELGDVGQTVREVEVVAPCGASVVVPVRTPYLVVNRLTLSLWGLERAQSAGATFLRTAVLHVERSKGEWVLEDSVGGAHRARWLVAADGAASRLRRQLAPLLRPELAPTRVVYPSNGTSPHRAVFRFFSAADGYLWDFPRPDRHSVGVGVAPGTFARAALDGALLQYRLAETGVDAQADSAGAVIATSLWQSGRVTDLGERDYALLGDAAGLADPATGEGIDYALRSAAIAAESFSESEGFTRYPSRLSRALHREMWRGRLVRKWLFHPGAADALVRRARQSPRGALLLMALVDAINEHGSLRRAVARALWPGRSDASAAEVVCDCPDGADASAPCCR